MKYLYILLACALALFSINSWGDTKKTSGSVDECVIASNPDINNDGIVDSSDLLIITQHHGNPKNYHHIADTNCDGVIDQHDIKFVNSAFGEKFPITSVGEFDSLANIYLSTQTDSIGNMVIVASKTQQDADYILIKDGIGPDTSPYEPVTNKFIEISYSGGEDPIGIAVVTDSDFDYVVQYLDTRDMNALVPWVNNNDGATIIKYRKSSSTNIKIALVKQDEEI